MAEWYTKSEVDAIVASIKSDIRVQFLRGSATNNDTYAGRAGELTIDSDQWNLRIHDGSTKGGHAVVGLGQVMSRDELDTLVTRIDETLDTLTTQMDTKMDKDDGLFDFGEI